MSEGHGHSSPTPTPTPTSSLRFRRAGKTNLLAAQLELEYARAAAKPRQMYIHSDDLPSWLNHVTLGPTQKQRVLNHLEARGHAECNGCIYQLVEWEDGFMVKCTFPTGPVS